MKGAWKINVQKEVLKSEFNVIPFNVINFNHMK